jgi:hypothetical protein
MKKSVCFLSVALFSIVTVLLSAGPTEARGFRAPVFPRNRMPGWDWRRTYPWSPYNYGRNPYNPAVVPYPYVAPYSYPIYNSYPVYYGTVARFRRR